MKNDTKYSKRGVNKRLGLAMQVHTFSDYTAWLQQVNYANVL